MTLSYWSASRRASIWPGRSRRKENEWQWSSGGTLVLGGGYIGLEMAQAFRRLGSRVTVIERNGTLIHREDPDVAAALGDLFRDEDIAVLTSTTLSRVNGTSGTAVQIQATGNECPVVVEGTHILAAAGRIPNTDGIGLGSAGVELDARVRCPGPESRTHCANTFSAIPQPHIMDLIGRWRERLP